MCETISLSFASRSASPLPSGGEGSEPCSEDFSSLAKIIFESEKW